MLPARICWKCGSDFTHAPPRAETRHGLGGLLVCDCRGCGAVYPAAPRRRGSLIFLAGLSLAWKLAAAGFAASLIATATKIHDEDLAVFGLGGGAIANGSAFNFPLSNASAYVQSIVREPSFGLVAPVSRAVAVLMLVLVCLLIRAPYFRSMLGVCTLALAIHTMPAAISVDGSLGPRGMLWPDERVGFAIALTITALLAAPGVMLVPLSRTMRAKAASNRFRSRLHRARARRRNA
jgi:hypothetical protein